MNTKILLFGRRRRGSNRRRFIRSIVTGTVSIAKNYIAILEFSTLGRPPTERTYACVRGRHLSSSVMRWPRSTPMPSSYRSGAQRNALATGVSEVFISGWIVRVGLVNI